MSKRAIITTIAAVFVVLIGIIAAVSTEKKPVNYGEYRMNIIRDLSKSLPRNKLNPDAINEPSDYTGNLPEKVIGDLDKAKVVVYEYADYACAHCAEWSKVVDKMVDDSDGKLAVVYRGYLLGFKNSVVVASAATAAQIQGCWQEYKDLLFSTQGKWASLSGEELKNELIFCFEKASDNKGDVEKFKTDMASENVAKKIAFEQRLGNEIGLEGTPTFRMDGETIDIKKFQEVVEEKLARA